MYSDQEPVSPLLSLSSPADRGPVKSVRRWVVYGGFGFALALGAPGGCLLFRKMTGEGGRGVWGEFSGRRVFFFFLPRGALVALSSFRAFFLVLAGPVGGG